MLFLEKILTLYTLNIFYILWNCKGYEIEPGTFVLDVGTGVVFRILYGLFPETRFI
jgi:hypothetical protein